MPTAGITDLRDGVPAVCDLGLKPAAAKKEKNARPLHVRQHTTAREVLRCIPPFRWERGAGHKTLEKT